MSDEAAFIRAIVADPDDDTVRLVFADWLEEHGQGERAELMRAAVAATSDFTNVSKLMELLTSRGLWQSSKLLRARWRRWQTERMRAPDRGANTYREFAECYADEELIAPGFQKEDFIAGAVRGCDKRFRAYIRKRFSA